MSMRHRPTRRFADLRIALERLSLARDGPLVRGLRCEIGETDDINELPLASNRSSVNSRCSSGACALERDATPAHDPRLVHGTSGRSNISTPTSRPYRDEISYASAAPVMPSHLHDCAHL